MSETLREREDRLIARLGLGRLRPGLVIGSVVTGLLALLFFWAWGYQLRHGIGVAGINRPVFWGLYITTFVFWIGISHAGTLISAILRVTGAEWRRPVTRCAEAITLFALSVGGLFPILHMGRAWKVHFMLPIPNSRQLWPNFRSPLAWDAAAITAYIVGSFLYLSLPLLPDMAILRDRSTGWRRRIFAFLALGWQGTVQQWRSLEAGIKVMAIVIIPLAVSVHTIVSWDFAMTQVPMWTSTIFGPYFVVGAIYSGIAMLMIAMAILRWGMDLGEYLSDKVFSNLGLLFVAMTLAWGYFTFAEHLTVWYSNEVAEARVLWDRLTGDFAAPFWTMVAVNFVIPILVLPFRWGRRPLPVAIVSAGVLVGMWLERYLIIVPSLQLPRLAYTLGSYTPSWVEISILIGSAGLFAFLYFTFTQAVPIISVWEVREGWQREAAHGRRRPEPAAVEPAPEAAGGGS
ncbi:MAG: NrfD/PsrC family molybdoenzyme membrane anchor subunit [Thermoanaerobaculia bacterium]|nr:NrfD/PsrC family molybdoenzyme membrane anchor subunit [Thermoanaerobaculia bacterium]